MSKGEKDKNYNQFVLAKIEILYRSCLVSRYKMIFNVFFYLNKQKEKEKK